MGRREMVSGGSAGLRLGDLGELPVVKVRVDSLLAADSPRLSGEDLAHIRVLAGADDPLPPIIVHRQSMRVIDGMHRLGAARLRGELTVDARLVDGDEASSFVLAVEANVLHGLPLSAAERKAAASRIISCYPQWSDRLIASVAGIAAKTVAAIRQCPTGDGQHLDARDGGQHLDARIGRDGRVRPRDIAERRTRAGNLMAGNPGASLREIARQAGISPETARQVRARLRNGQDPTPGGEEHACGAAQPARARPPVPPPRTGPPRHPGAAAVSALMADPALRSTETGRALLRMLAAATVLEQHRQQLIDAVPAHCIPKVAQTARACGELWRDLAQQMERHTQPAPAAGPRQRGEHRGLPARLEQAG
jgi:ParB-like nuclease domain